MEIKTMMMLCDLTKRKHID